MKKRLTFITILAALLIGAGIAVSVFVMHWRALAVAEEITGYEIGARFPLNIAAIPQGEVQNINAQLKEQCPELHSYLVMDPQQNALKVLVVHPNSLAISKTHRHRINETVWAWLAQQSILQDRAAQAAASTAQASQKQLEQLHEEITQLKADKEALLQRPAPEQQETLDASASESCSAGE